MLSVQRHAIGKKSNVESNHYQLPVIASCGKEAYLRKGNHKVHGGLWMKESKSEQKSRPSEGVTYGLKSNSCGDDHTHMGHIPRACQKRGCVSNLWWQSLTCKPHWQGYQPAAMSQSFFSLNGSSGGSVLTSADDQIRQAFPEYLISIY